MSAQKTQQTNAKEMPLKTTPFDYSQINMILPDMGEGVLQLVAIPFKFEQPGQRLIGVYMGSNVCISSYDEQKTYLYHKVWLPTGHLVGFHGSTQIDGALASMPTEKYEIDIEYLDDNSLGKGKSIKLFSIVARAIVYKKYPQLKTPVPTYEFEKPAEMPF